MNKIHLLFLVLFLSTFCANAQHVLNFPIPSCPYVFVENNRTDSGINIYPNPGREILNIEFSQTNITVDINIYDVFGKWVYSKFKICVTNNGISIDVSGFSKGTYLLHINNEALSHTTRFIIY